MYSQTACSLDRTVDHVEIELHFPNTTFCQIQILASSPIAGPILGMAQLADELIVEVSDSSTGQGMVQTLKASERGDTLLAGVGTNALFVTKMAIRTKGRRPLHDVIRETLRSRFGSPENLAAYAIPITCPAR